MQMANVLVESSVPTIVQGHDDWGVVVYYHQIMGEVIFDYSMLEHLATGEQEGYMRGAHGISEPAYYFAEEEAYQDITA